MLRALPTSWFELITTRQDYAAIMQELAKSGAAQLEVQPLEGAQPVFPHLERFFSEFEDLKKRYELYWPAASEEATEAIENPLEAIRTTLEVLEGWAAKADPLIAAIQTAETRQSNLRLTAALRASIGADYPFEQLSESAGHLLSRAVYFLPEDSGYTPTDDILTDSFATNGGKFVVVMGQKASVEVFRDEMRSLGAVSIQVPDFDSATKDEQQSQISRWQEQNEASLNAAKQALAELNKSLHLPEVLSRVSLLKWLYDNSGGVQATKRTIRITGWTSSESGDKLRQALDTQDLDYVLSIAKPNTVKNPPTLLKNPSWVKAFEFFPRLLGVPQTGQIDPTLVIALISPLLFGFMFGDVGQGAILIAAGFALRGRMPFLGMLIPGGIMAVFFGFMFGSVFSREDLVPPLWLHPLEAPITLLAAALMLGAALLVIGISLDFLQAVWRRNTYRWLLANGGITVTFLSLLFVFWLPLMSWGLVLGVILTIAGARDSSSKWSFGAAGKSVAEFVENLMRLLVNSVSFSRVGAFALAHAGLSTAIIGVAEAAGDVGYWVVLVLGNVLILGLEGLVVGIQTTRLILFEFFIRFFKAEGREFHPMTSPEFHTDYQKGETS